MTKAAVFADTGRQLASAGEETPQASPRPGWCDRDMDALWEASARSVRAAVEKANIDPEKIAGVGCTGHGKGLYLWGKDGKPAAPAVASTDHRAKAVAAAWRADGTAAAVGERTLQPVLDCQPAALLRWYKENNPAVYANIRWVFEAKDYIRFRLTGEAFAEYTDYSGTSLMNLHTRQFDPAILRLFGIEEIRKALPPLRTAAAVCGTVTERAAAETGIPAGTPVCGGMFDIDACAIAMDVSEENRLCVITGTWSINEYIAPSPVCSGGTTMNSLFCLPEYYLIEESSPTSAGNLDWVLNALFGETGKEAYRRADSLVEALPPEDSQTLFFPFLYGSNLDGLDDAAFLGLRLGQDRAHLLRAVFEGVAFSHKTHVERLLAHNPALGAVRLAGGAAHSAVWVQLFADVLGLPVEVVETAELGAKGAAMAAAVAAGIYPDFRQAARAMVTISYTVMPAPAKVAIYQDKYERYCRVAKALGGIG